MSGNVKAWVAEQQGRHFCKCGCGEVIVVKRHHYFRGVPALRPAHGKKKPLDARFWEKVLKTESCWIWTASKDTHGYGKVRYGGKNIRAHRTSWEMRFGPLPPGLYVLHDCPSGDNPACVNPDHLWLGTQVDNMRDASRKGRIYCGGTHGEENGRSKLTKADVLEIRRLAVSGVSPKELSSVYLVCVSSINRVISRRSWKHT
jgi:hypothetical protein